MASEPYLKNKNRVYQKFNLKDMFGIDLGKFPEIKEAIGQAIIEKIIKRTTENVGIDGNKFEKYDDKYAESLAFKAAGKRKGNVNLKLTGDMLDLMDIIDVSKNTITIGWDDELQNNKAHGHNTGAKGRIPVRPFFGLNAKEQKEIARMFKAEVKEAVEILKTEGRDPYTEKIMALIDKVKSEIAEDDE
jgi:phage gpG-like protein